MLRPTFAIVLVCLTPLPLAAQQPPGTRVDLGGDEVKLPVTIRLMRLIVPLTINGQGPYDFFFDPAGQGSIVDQALVETLKLPSLRAASVKSNSEAKKTMASSVVFADKVEFGGVAIANVQLVSVPRGSFGIGGPVGMISPTLFSGHLVTLDVAAKEMRFRSGKLPFPDNKQVFAYLDRNPQPSLKIDVAGVAVDASLDFGSNGGLTLPRSFVQRVPVTAPPVEAGKVRSDRGEFTFADATIKGKLRFGRFERENPPVRFSDVVQRGNIGVEILKGLALTIDIRQRRFRLDPSAAKPEP